MGKEPSYTCLDNEFKMGGRGNEPKRGILSTSHFSLKHLFFLFLQIGGKVGDNKDLKFLGISCRLSPQVSNLLFCQQKMGLEKKE